MRILVAEDDAVTRRLLVSALERWKYEVIAAADGRQALNALLSVDPPQLAILDWVMPGADGTEICRQLRQREQGPYVYVLLLTAKSAKEDVLSGLEAGADDYLTKPFDLLELKARLRSGQRIIQLQDQLIAAREKMRDQSMHDGLTGLWNGTGILGILRREFSRAAREGAPLSCLMLDLDHFKRVNDSLGHQTGDETLRGVAEKLLTVLRPYDALGRYGGEEFLVVVPGCDQTAAAALAERIRRVIGDAPISTSRGSVCLTLSLGGATLADDPDPESLVRRADEALYRAKDAGRNCFREA